MAVKGVKESNAAALALRSVSKEARSAVNRETRKVVNKAWREELAGKARTSQDTRILLKGAKVVGTTAPTLTAASSRKALRGGLVPAESWRAQEFGAARNERSTYQTRSRKGKPYRVTRRTKRQLPDHRKGGRVLYPAVGEMGPRMFALWTQTTIREIYNALKKGSI